MRVSVESEMGCDEDDPELRIGREKLAYIHGFDAGVDLLCAKARLSNPAIAENVRELAGKMAEETAETLRAMKDKKRLINAVTSLYGK